MDTTTEAKRLNQDSMWKRPTAYVTTVALYLLILSAILISFNIYIFYSIDVQAARFDLVYGWGYLTPVIIAMTIIFISVFSWGAKLLFSRKRKGVLISFGGLTPATLFSVFLTVSWLLNTSTIEHNPALFSITVAFLTSNAIMYILLIKGLKQVQWN